MSSIDKQAGFTLLELLISLAVAAIVMAAVYSSYYSQQKTYVTQDQVVMMQQNLRAAMYYLERDVRMTGYDPTGRAGAGIPNAPTATSFQLTKDDNNNAGTGVPDGDVLDANENVTYSHNSAQKKIVRNPGNQTIAENIDALNFVCLDENGAVTATPNAVRSVQISIVARTARIDPGYKDTTVYRNLQGTAIFTPAGNDVRYRRNNLSVEVRCRNLGL